MTEDRELASWREEWGRVEKPSPDLRRKIQQKIKRQERRFMVGNVLTAIAFVGMLIFAGFLRSQSNWLGMGWAAGVCALVLVSVVIRLFALKGTWRAETQSIRAYVELWQRRVQARIRLLRISIYVALGWLVFCAGLTIANWGTIGIDVRARPKEWLTVLILSVVMQPVIWWWAAWLRRRKMAELDEVKRVLDEMRG